VTGNRLGVFGCAGSQVRHYIGSTKCTRAYVRRATDGSADPEAQIARFEFLNRNAGHRTEAVSTIEKLAETGFSRT